MANRRKILIIKWVGLIINAALTAGTFWGLFAAGVSWFAFAFFVVTGYFCMITQELFYHRYFAHQSFKTGRVFQFIMGILAELAPVRGPIWWAANHRDHHKYTDTKRDPHAPIQGNWQSYMGWVYREECIAHSYKNSADLTRYPELRFIDRLYYVPMFLSFWGVYALGAYLEKAYPGLGTSGLQLLTWGGFLRVLYPLHIMAWINYFAHQNELKWGYRNFDSPDHSRNITILSILGAGVGLHNNHHKHGRYASTAVLPGEIDPSKYVLIMLEKLGLVWNVRWVPESYRQEALAYRERVASEGREPEAKLPKSA